MADERQHADIRCVLMLDWAGIWLPAILGIPFAIGAVWALDTGRDMLGGVLWVPGGILLLAQVCVLVIDAT